MLRALAMITCARCTRALTTRARVRCRAADPFRPEVGSPAPLAINALVAMERGASARACDAPDVAVLVEALRPELQGALVRTCAEEPWIAKYKEEGRFGLPLTDKDPLVCMQRNECLLGIYLLARHPDGLESGGGPLLRAEDFLDPDRLDVMAAGALEVELQCAWPVSFVAPTSR